MTIVRHSIGLSVIQRKQSISHSAKVTMRYYIATAIIISVINHGGLLFKLQSRQQILFSKLRPQIESSRQSVGRHHCHHHHAS